VVGDRRPRRPAAREKQSLNQYGVSAPVRPIRKGGQYIVVDHRLSSVEVYILCALMSFVGVRFLKRETPVPLLSMADIYILKEIIGTCDLRNEFLQ
jgi:hypothetical protein